MYNSGTKLYVYLYVLLHGVSGGKILGGREALQGEFPFAVRIGGGILCSGSLVTLVKVVSAGHCFEFHKSDGNVEHRDLSISYVVAGTIYYKEISGGYQERRIISYKLAKGAEMKHSGDMCHDVAVAVLNEPFDPSHTVKVMTMKTSNPIKFKQSWDEFVLTGQKCLSIGWGTTVLTNQSGQYLPSVISHVLKVIEIIPWTDEACSETVWQEDQDLTKEGEVCCSPVKAEETILPGDSGSPLICSGMVWGVLSSYDNEKSTNATSHFVLLFKYIDELQLTDSTTAIATAFKAIPTSLIIYILLLLTIL